MGLFVGAMTMGCVTMYGLFLRRTWRVYKPKHWRLFKDIMISQKAHTVGA